MARSSVTNKKLPELYERGNEELKRMMAQQEYVHLTTDIWSDRRMRSFLGITAHVIGKTIASKDCNALNREK